VESEVYLYGLLNAMYIPIMPLTTAIAGNLTDFITHLNNPSVTRIDITSNISMTTSINVNRNLTLGGSNSITFTNNAARIDVTSGAHLIIDGPTIQRTGGNSTSEGVRMGNGTSLTLRNGSIRDHQEGVHVPFGITNVQIILEGGFIEFNMGGGIRAQNGTSITMYNGAVIRNNGLPVAPTRIGGVFLNAGATFVMHGGEITNNKPVLEVLEAV
jgi:hypothetical protein